MTSSNVTFPRLIDVLPDEDLEKLSVEELEQRYLSRVDVNYIKNSPSSLSEYGSYPKYAIWFEYIVPEELDLIFPTTDSKLNYMSFTSRLASALHHGLHMHHNTHDTSSVSIPCQSNYDGECSVTKDDTVRNTGGIDCPECEHSQALKGRSNKFASIIDRFLDLHQILRES